MKFTVHIVKEESVPSSERMHRALRGFPDWIGDSARRLSAIECKIRDSVIRYGSFQEVRLPFVETKDLFARAAGAADAVNKELWSWQSKSGEEDKFVALRPEGTAGAIRCLIEKNLHREFGRYWYCGPMFRYERPQKGRFRQFTQFGVEIVGDDHPNTDVEAIAMAKHALDELGLSEHVKVRDCA